MKVSLILKNKGSSEVATVSPDQSIAEAVSVLSTLKIGALVVVDANGEVKGILSERDIVRNLGSQGVGALERHVHDLMTEAVESCVVDDTAFDVLGRMTTGRFRHMPVMGQTGDMIGILSIGDVVKARLEEIESENAAMADMLSG